ncbi:MAG: hypothetical protein K2H18_00920, partial [Muribaculaceae bacterium]|nr:hypothetical protein [Muribaculaceae bacterium]
MRKLIFLLLVAICGCGCLSADEIVLRDATSLNGVVKEVRPDKVLFRKRGENFDREISVDKVFKIKYDNGTEEKLATVSSPVRKDETSVDYIRNGRYYNVSTQPNYSVFPPASKVYYVGDWYSENGVEGIVVETTPDGRHGRIISHKDAPLKNFNNGHGWGFWFKGGKDVPIGTNDRSNGYANLQKLRAFQKAHPEYDSQMFPVQTALDEWGSGWYVPSIDEMA